MDREQLRGEIDAAASGADVDVDAAIDAYVAAERAKVIDTVQAVYDVQCPVRTNDDYQPGARMAHLWWQRVLGGVLRELRGDS